MHFSPFSEENKLSASVFIINGLSSIMEGRLPPHFRASEGRDLVRTPPETYVENGGVRYIPRHEITALVGGNGILGDYHHILACPPTVKVVATERRQTAYPPKKSAVQRYRRKNPAIFWYVRLLPK